MNLLGKPKLIIRLKTGDYLYRWHLIPRNKWFNIYLHKTVKDDYRILHDHPWDNLSIVLWGGYWEQTIAGIFWRSPGSFIYRKAEQAHRLILMPYYMKHKEIEGPSTPCWSLFITGRLRRDWGFYTKAGWKSHKEMLDLSKYSQGISIFRDEMVEYI